MSESGDGYNRMRRGARRGLSRRVPEQRERSEERERQGRFRRQDAHYSAISTSPAKTPVILSKSVEKDSAMVPEKLVLLRPRNDGAEGCLDRAHAEVLKHDSTDPIVTRTTTFTVMKPDTTSASTSHTTHTSGNLMHSRLGPNPIMTQSVKIIDESLCWCDNLAEMLVDHSDFLVVGVIGAQGTGKSTIMSLLAGNKYADAEKSFVFRPERRDFREKGIHETLGADMFITSERMILLDTQPILSASMLDQQIRFDKQLPAEVTFSENALEMQSLQMAIFILSVCNIVLVVDDLLTNIEVLRFIRCAEMLKPSFQTLTSPIDSGSAGLDENVEYFPSIVFVQNHGELADYTSQSIQSLCDTVNSVFQFSKLRIKGDISMLSSELFPGLSHLATELNLYILPSHDSSDSDEAREQLSGFKTLSAKQIKYEGHPSLPDLASMLQRQILGVTRSPFQPGFTEKNWILYAQKQWDNIKKSPLISEYSRLLS